MDTSELRTIYSPGTNNLIKWQFRLKRMACQAWGQECMRIGWYLRTEVLISTIVGLLILECTSSVITKR